MLVDIPGGFGVIVSGVTVSGVTAPDLKLRLAFDPVAAIDNNTPPPFTLEYFWVVKTRNF